MPKTSQKIFLTPRGAKGGEYSGGTVGEGGTVFLNSAFMVFLVIFLETLAKKPPKNFFDSQGGQGGE